VDESHILIQYILVEAGSTQPTIAKEDIYLENVEWTTSTYTTGAATGSIDFNNPVSPKQGVKCISANADARLGARFVKATSFDPYQYTMLSMWVRFTGSNVATNKSLNVRFENGAGALVANTINLFNFGLQRNLLNVWQLVVIPITSFGALPATVKGMKIIMAGGTVGQARQWDIDLISLTDNSVPFINEQVFNVLKDGALVGQSSSLNFKGAPVTVTNDPINKKIDIEVIGGSQIAFTKTKAEIDTLIAGNDLVAGAMYEITGVHPTLYDDGTTSGTTVYLRAISGSELEVQGMGKFYNPKYNKSVDGFGIWDNKMYGTLSNVVGVFDYLNKELVTADNGATGILLADGMIQFVSGNWSSATSITGGTSSATANVVDFVSPSYAINDKVIWGGYSWTNVNGNIGASTDVLNLDSEWSKDFYDTTNYNIAYDVIEYDYVNDWISRRYAPIEQIDVIYSKIMYDLNNNENGFLSAISVQQFGNKFDFQNYLGVGFKVINNSYDESVNFNGTQQVYIIMIGSSSQYNLTFGQSSSQNNLTFGASSSQYNLTFGQSSSQNNLTFGQSSIQNNLAFGQDAYQSYLTFGQNANQYNLTFGQDANQYNLTFGQGASQNNLTFGQKASQFNLTFGQNANQYNLTFGQGASQNNLTFGQSASQNNLTFGQDANQFNLTFENNASQYNLTFGNNAYQQYLNFAENTQLNYNNQTLNSNIEYVSFRTKAITVPDLSTATYIYDGNIKEVYQRPDGALKIKYYDNSDVLQIVDIDD